MAALAEVLWLVPTCRRGERSRAADRHRPGASRASGVLAGPLVALAVLELAGDKELEAVPMAKTVTARAG